MTMIFSKPFNSFQVDSLSKRWAAVLLLLFAWGVSFLFFMFPPGRGKAGTMFNVSIPIISQEWMKITVTMDRKECRIYVNDTERGKFPCRELPPFCSEPVRIGIYSPGGRFGFPAQFRNLIIERKAVSPNATTVNKR